MKKISTLFINNSKIYISKKNIINKIKNINNPIKVKNNLDNLSNWEYINYVYDKKTQKDFNLDYLDMKSLELTLTN